MENEQSLQLLRLRNPSRSIGFLYVVQTLALIPELRIVTSSPGMNCVAVKSGWDQNGIAFGMPTKQLVIRRITCVSPTSAVIALGSEMSGGIQDVRA